MVMPIGKSEKEKIAETLALASEPVIREIIREAEAFLADQFKAALAADSRAMSLAGILAAISTFLVGSSASLAAAKVHIWPFVWPVGAIVVFLLIALCFAVRAAWPVSFEYCGNDPKCWVPDVNKKKTLVESLVGQAVLYSGNIYDNAETLSKNQHCLKSALWWAIIGVMFGSVAESWLIGEAFYEGAIHF
jgi:hypothetical protein